MFYDRRGKNIREGSIVKFNNEEYVIKTINGDYLGADGTSTLTFDRKPSGNETPCEVNVECIVY